MGTSFALHFNAIKTRTATLPGTARGWCDEIDMLCSHSIILEDPNVIFFPNVISEQKIKDNFCHFSFTFSPKKMIKVGFLKHFRQNLIFPYKSTGNRIS